LLCEAGTIGIDSQRSFSKCKPIAAVAAAWESEMQSKKLWLATTALALTLGQANAQGLYISVFGGTNFQPDTNHQGFLQSHTYEPDTGFAIGGAIGAGLDNWVAGMRVEIEASYRRNDVGGSWRSATSTGTTSGLIDANASTFALMANVAYDIDVGQKFKPYVMAGAGWGRSSYEGALAFSGGGTASNFDQDNSGFAWQLGAGVNYEVAPGVDVGVGYRYFDGPNNSFFAGKNSFNRVKIDNTNHAVMLNLTIETN
jgi:outer membrane autotransporter protein